MDTSVEEWMTAAPKPANASDLWAQDYGRTLKGIVTRYAGRLPRSVQRHLGPSELGHECDRQVVAKMAGAKMTNHVADPWASIVGTAAHAFVADAFNWDNAHNGYQRWLAEARVTPDPGPDPHPGTADLYDAFYRCVVDHKFQGDTTRARLKNSGPPRHYYVQLLLYRRGYLNLGLPVERIVIASWPRTRSTLDEMYVWSHVPTAADDRLVEDVLAQTRYRQQLADAVAGGAFSLMDVPATPEDTECYFCLAGDTEVVTRQGVQRIRELAGTEPELLVPQVSHGVHTRRGSFQAHPVRKFGEQELYKITLEDRRSRKEVLATAEHGWFVASRQRSGRRRPNTERRVTTDNLKPGDLLVPLRRSVAADPGRMDVAVAQGFTFGDGTRGQGERPGTLSVYANGKDAVMLPFFPQARQYDGVKHVYGLPRFWKELPPLAESRAFLLSWLAGYFAADGTVSEAGMCSLSSSSETNIRFVRDLAAVCGVGYRPWTVASRLGTGTEKTDLYELPLRRRDLPAWFFLVEEHRRRAEAANAKPERESYWKVASVERTGRREPVYCATVDQVHAFGLADDLMTANCGLYRPQAAYDGAYGCPGTLLEKK